MDAVKVYAPATIANLGPGFDVLGMALTGMGDMVEAKGTAAPGVTIEAITGDNGRLPLSPDENTAGIAALEALRIVGASTGVALRVHKGLPLGSGLGSSAASAAAAVWAVALLNGFDDKPALLPACMAAEEAVSGYHADNVAPALLGGLILIQDYHPLRVESLAVPEDLVIVIVTPDHEVPTADARAVVPSMIPLAQVVSNAGHLSAMIAAGYRGHTPDFGRAMVDEIIEPARAHLIPGFYAVKQAALEAGAFGCSIGGSGPTIFAVTDSQTRGERISKVMVAAFRAVGLSSTANIARVDTDGARKVE